MQQENNGFTQQQKNPSEQEQSFRNLAVSDFPSSAPSDILNDGLVVAPHWQDTHTAWEEEQAAALLRKDRDAHLASELEAVALQEQAMNSITAPLPGDDDGWKKWLRRDRYANVIEKVQNRFRKTEDQEKIPVGDNDEGLKKWLRKDTYKNGIESVRERWCKNGPEGQDGAKHEPVNDLTTGGGFEMRQILVPVAIGVGVYTLAPVVIPGVLSAAGFTKGGVAAGSYAASMMGPATAKGSAFALAQSAGATGTISTFSAGSIGVIGTAGSAIPEYLTTKDTNEEVFVVDECIRTNIAQGLGLGRRIV